LYSREEDYLLTGQNLENSDHPLARTLFSGQFIDEDQVFDYGPAQYLTPGQVKEVNAEISKITTEEIVKNYDPKKMSELEIYPNIWDEEDNLDYLRDYFKTVQEVYSEAAQNNQVIITFLIKIKRLHTTRFMHNLTLTLQALYAQIRW